MPIITAFDKLLRNKAFKIAKNPKSDGYQRGLAPMAYKFFDKNSATTYTGTGNNSDVVPETQQLAKELHKPIIKNFLKM